MSVFWTWQTSNAARQLNSLACVVNDDAHFPADIPTEERGWGKTPNSTCRPDQMIQEMDIRTGKTFQYTSKLVEWSCKWSCFWNVESLGEGSAFALTIGYILQVITLKTDFHPLLLKVSEEMVIMYPRFVWSWWAKEVHSGEWTSSFCWPLGSPDPI